jgi:CheY-like chemotaxis protein
MALERKAREEAERIGRVKDDFLANLSHELRTPINTILGWAQLITPGKTTAEDLAKGLEVITRNARRQAQLIEDLLDLSRVVSGKMRLNVQRVELPAVIDAALESVKVAADVKGIRIEKVIDPLSGPVTGDPARLQQVIWNLLANAVKFTPAGGKVQVILERVNSHLDLSVSDNGRGITPEFLPHVFERLRQAESGPKPGNGGLGLGLAIVKSLTELHSGTVIARSAGLGQGSTFVISLPVSLAHAKRDNKGREHPASEPDITEPFRPTLEGVHVLVVDDDTDSVELVKRVLLACGATVSTAASGVEGLERFREKRPAVILTDLNMPEMNGYDFCRKVRALKPADGGAVAMAALTAMARSEDRRRTMLAGFDIHVAKPVEPAELVAVIGRLARRT